MKARVISFFVLAALTTALYSCGEDTPPEKTAGSITIVVTEDNTNETLSGVSIQLFSDDDTSVTPADRTDNSGRCTFYNIPIGSYHMNLSKPGYESKEGLTLRINGGDNPNKELSLKRITTELTVNPSTLDFGDNASVVQKAFSLVNPNYADLTWAVLDTDVAWIVSVCDKDGKKNGTIKYNQEVAMSVTIDRYKLTSGNNESTIVILSDYGRAELKVKAIGADRRTPTTNMLEVTDVDMTTAVFNGEVLSVGSPEYTERGFVYSTSIISAEATSGFTTVAAQMNSNKTFSVSVSGLDKGTTYYVRAYGKNSVGTKLSSNYVSFTTIASKTAVSTQAVTQIDVVNGKAQFNGEITEIGNPVYSEKGFCYNKSGEPTVSDTKVVVSGTSGGAYSYSCAGLSSNTVYYVRAYAMQGGKVLYGDTQNFSLEVSATVVSTSSATNITSSAAVLNGSILQLGSPAYSEKGFCISQSDPPTINSTKKAVNDGSATGNYKLQLSGLDYNKRYYFRAYAIQNGSPVYGEVRDFTTVYTQAEVITSDVSDIGYHTMTFNGQVIAIGDPSITERGFCYSSTYDRPTISHNKVKASGVSASAFKVTVNNLEEDTKYYVRAYVIQDGKPVYSSVINNAKTALEPLVSTGPAINIKLSSNGINWEATFQGGFADGEPAVTDAGFVYSTSDNPTVSNGTKVKYDSVTKVDTDIYKFTKTVTNLSAYKTYYFRAYVVTSLSGKTQYTYGETVSFQTY